ncbi:MAG: peptidyl-prolyl cis-trans isomerase [Myxococcota bacterium]|nr:peptidyl-prolyl cis-trans isomerase [Myxococcota bacterium]
MKRLLEEPLVHFLLLGAGIFAVFSLVSGGNSAPSDAVVVSAGKVEHLGALFERTWQRPPTRAELEGLVQDFVREEVAYREGLAAGLDRDDTIIRRRIRQKVDFLAEDFARRAEPADAELSAYLAAHPESFRVEPRLTFRQVYFDPDERGDGLEAELRDLLIALDGDPTLDTAALGDRILLQDEYADVTEREIADLFGAGFAAAVAALPPGAWHGAIRSGYGVHLVRVDARTEGRTPELDEVRRAVRREWDNARREEAIERFYAEMIDRYDVRIEWPESGPNGHP